MRAPRLSEPVSWVRLKGVVAEEVAMQVADGHTKEAASAGAWRSLLMSDNMSDNKKSVRLFSRHDLKKIMEMGGFDPPASRMQSERSAN